MKDRKEEEKSVCTICIEEIDVQKEARVSGCQHRFCFECINHWAKTCSNTCPNCKVKFKEIIYKDVLERDQKVKVQDKDIDQDDEFYACLYCSRTVNEEEGNYLICEDCLDQATHIDCAASHEHDDFESAFWVCPNCLLLSDVSEEEDSDSDYDDHLVEDFMAHLRNYTLHRSHQRIHQATEMLADRNN